MTRPVGIGYQDFADIREEGIFYIDKTTFIKEWWENYDSVTLITRPRRFGKTLAMSMVEEFFSVQYAGRADLFEGLCIWGEESYRQIQGTYPVISLSFANVKEQDYKSVKQRICQILTDLYNKHQFLLEGNLLTDEEKRYFRSISMDMPEVVATLAIHRLSDFLYRYYGKKVIILLDEYDTPMQEAYVNGYWEELAAFTRSMFNAAFKTNPYLARAIMTGITRVGKESIFSDLNNLVVVTTTSNMYEESFGFTEQEVFAALEEYGLADRRQEVKSWYDGFTFGRKGDIYNPWSVLNFLKTGVFAAYWANTSSNSLIGMLIREGSRRLKQTFEDLLKGESLRTQIDEQVVYSQLNDDESAIWSLLLASGYLKVKNYEMVEAESEEWASVYELELTNFEVKLMFRNMIRGWFTPSTPDYQDFIQALLADDVEAMNVYMNRVALVTFSYFDTGRHHSEKGEPERFYHGFVLGLLVELADRYYISSNRESGFGRYDIMLEPRKAEDDAMIMEFKVHRPEKEKTLEDTALEALAQIERKNYAAGLEAKGVPKDKIRRYGFAFEGKKVLIL